LPAKKKIGRATAKQSDDHPVFNKGFWKDVFTNGGFGPK